MRDEGGRGEAPHAWASRRASAARAALDGKEREREEDGDPAEEVLAALREPVGAIANASPPSAAAAGGASSARSQT